MEFTRFNLVARHDKSFLPSQQQNPKVIKFIYEKKPKDYLVQ